MNNSRQILWRIARTILGLTIGALVSTAAAMFLNRGNPGIQPRFVSDTLTMTLFVLLFALPVGLIGHATLYALKRRHLLYYSGLGFIGGSIFAMVFFHDDPGEIPINVLNFGLWAGTCAAIAWLIRRPDKDEVKMPDPASHF